jgi:hypothetical protein
MESLATRVTILLPAPRRVPAVSRRTKSRLVLVLLVLFLNLPLVHSTWTRYRVESSGDLVTATVVEGDVLGDAADPAYWIRYRLPESAVRDGTDQALLEQNREVSRAAFDEAMRAQRIGVRVLDGQPLTSRAVGQVTAYAGLWFTLVADLLLVGFLFVLWRFGRFGRPELLRLEAVGDVRSSSDEPGVGEADDSGVLEVSGDVVEVTDHDVLLRAGRRRVVVVLDGRAALATPGERATARGRRLG